MFLRLKPNIKPRYMNLFLIFLIFILLSIAFFFIYTEIIDSKLLKTVTSKNRGTKSERKMVLKILKSGIKSTAVFHDLYLNNGNGKYSQIDLVIATNVGIVVFEIKEYSGWIFGTEKQKNWTQILAYGKQKYKFYNPLFQNIKHIEDLKNNYHFEGVPFFSIIVFFGNCQFKNSVNLPSNTFLTKSSDVIKIFNEILQNNQLVKYNNKWDIVNFLKQAVKNGESPLIIEKHIENIQKLKAENRFY